MLIRFFSSIRKKPKEVRDQYAFWIALTVTGLIAVPWFFGLPGQLTSNRSDVQSEPIFSSFLNEAGGRFSEVTESIQEARNPELETLTSSSSTSTVEVDMSFITSDPTPVVATSSSEAPPREVRIATTTASTTQ